MIVVDSSALMAILLDEPEADACQASLETGGDLVMSAATLAEALIVAERHGLGGQMLRLVEGVGIEIVDVTRARAQRVADVYARWGKGVDPASLNFGDCFSYALAAERNCPLLFVGGDFSKTGIPAA